MRVWTIKRDLGRVRLYVEEIPNYRNRRTEVTPTASLAVRNHSPTGFECGYAGSGPAQLALALLLDFFGGETMPDMIDAPMWIRDVVHDNYQMFKDDVIAKIKLRNGDSVQIDEDEIRAWLHGQRAADAMPFRCLRGS